ncbi:MAG TPA: twin-arginine translocase TatA/TatE family subunit [Actinomycetota bacterium]
MFGASRLPSLGRNFGRGIAEFKKGLTEAWDDTEAAAPPPADEDASASQADPGGSRAAGGA